MQKDEKASIGNVCRAMGSENDDTPIDEGIHTLVQPKMQKKSNLKFDSLFLWHTLFVRSFDTKMLPSNWFDSRKHVILSCDR